MKIRKGEINSFWVETEMVNCYKSNAPRKCNVERGCCCHAQYGDAVCKAESKPVMIVTFWVETSLPIDWSLVFEKTYWIAHTWRNK